jgi:hypothetical protein
MLSGIGLLPKTQTLSMGNIEKWGVLSFLFQLAAPYRGNLANLQDVGRRSQMGSGLSRSWITSAHSLRRLLTRHLKTCSLVTLFTMKSM